MLGAIGFMMGGVGIFNVASVTRKGISARIAGRVCGFVSIATKRATSELISPLSFSVYYIIPHLWHGRFQMDVVGGLRCLELNKESTGLL